MDEVFVLVYSFSSNGRMVLFLFLLRLSIRNSNAVGGHTVLDPPMGFTFNYLSSSIPTGPG